MRKIFLPVAALVFTSLLHAQTQSKTSHFRFDLGFGSIAFSSGAPFVFSAEPSWRLGPYKIGARLEGTFKMYMKDEASQLLTLERYFNNKHELRFFAGGGIGLFQVSESGSCSGGPTTTQTIHSTEPLGGMLRMGFEYHKFRFSTEYNAVQKTYVRDYDASKILMGTRAYSSSYLSVKAGVIIGKR